MPLVLLDMCIWYLLKKKIHQLKHCGAITIHIVASTTTVQPSALGHCVRLAVGKNVWLLQAQPYRINPASQFVKSISKRRQTIIESYSWQRVQSTCLNYTNEAAETQQAK